MTYANRSPLTAHKITGIAQIELAVQLTATCVGQDSGVQHRVTTARPVSLTAHR